MNKTKVKLTKLLNDLRDHKQQVADNSIHIGRNGCDECEQIWHLICCELDGENPNGE